MIMSTPSPYSADLGQPTDQRTDGPTDRRTDQPTIRRNRQLSQSLCTCILRRRLRLVDRLAGVLGGLHDLHGDGLRHDQNHGDRQVRDGVVPAQLRSTVFFFRVVAKIGP